jgi:N-carbamoylputrescine amidase
MKTTSLTVGLVQEKWHSDPVEHQAQLAKGIFHAARKGAKLVCLQELTLSPYFCTRPDAKPALYSEDIETGPTSLFLKKIAQEANVFITASLFEKAGYNTAIAFNPKGELIAVTRKQHIPSGEKYHEDHYFKSGDSDYPVHEIAGLKIALPTCYDQWFPELSRIYGLKGADIIIYPTAIGSEPTAPDFDSQPMWQKVMVAQGIMANTFIIAINRIGNEDGLEFYGSSFVSNPYGEILVQASRDNPQVLVTTLDLTQKEKWQTLFPFAQQRQPQTYGQLIQPINEKK